MGIGETVQDIRGCLGEKSGYKGDISTTEGREGLKKHLKKNVKWILNQV